jgi:beta-phosphoglucomutase-like phosphatase (HAD superfamily)
MLKKSGLNDAPELTKLKAGVTNIQLLIELSKLQTELEAYKEQQPASEFELPEASELLNRLKAKRKKATASLADIEVILEILEELTPLGEN